LGRLDGGMPLGELERLWEGVGKSPGGAARAASNASCGAKLASKREDAGPQAGSRRSPRVTSGFPRQRDQSRASPVAIVRGNARAFITPAMRPSRLSAANFGCSCAPCSTCCRKP
jgi:hypothetical protein